MRLRVKHIFVQTHNPRLTENQIEILQCLCRPEALYTILFRGLTHRDVFELRVGEFGRGVFLDGLEHGSGGIL